ncbi:hypothetical protein C0995_000011 [Termitomyces sp. Mi166|nr:hypothetical protein C0995_000011 [Termitomyces sp. Mi166\
MAIKDHTVHTEKSVPALDEKIIDSKPIDVESVEFKETESDEFRVLENERDIVTRVISVADDPTLNPWTIRAFVIGIGLSAFGGVLAEIYYFKPQTVVVSTMFLAVISYALGMAFSKVIPSRGIFRYLNPHPFNKKENAFIVIMSSAAATSALGTEVLAVQRLFYNITPNPGATVLLYPSKMLYPGILPLASMLDTFFKESSSGVKKKFRIFWIVFGVVVFVAVFYKNIWQARTLPFLSQELFYANGTVYNQLLILNDKLEVDPELLRKEGLPFYAGSWIVQLLTTNLGLAATFTHLLLWNRHDLRNAWTWMTPTELKRMWKNFDIRFWRDEGIRNQADFDEDIDPHYREMLKYPDSPNSWYLVCLVISIVMALVIIYKTNSTLPWWGFVIAVLLATLSILFFGTLYAITGLQFIIQPFVQMIGGFIHPGKPMANMYFVLFSYNSVNQALLLSRDLKIAQYTKLPPRAAFTAQIIGTLFGAVLNYSLCMANVSVLMNSIIDNQRPILLSVEGTNIWSGQQPQQYNSQAIAWGGLSHELFAVGQRYQFVAWAYVIGLFVPVPFWLAYRYFPKLRTDYLYTPVIW